MHKLFDAANQVHAPKTRKITKITSNFPAARDNLVPISVDQFSTANFSNFHVPLCQISQLTAASVSNSMIIQEDYHFCQKAS